MPLPSSSLPYKRILKARGIHPRLNEIHQIIAKRGFPSKLYLAERFGCSIRTIERDLDQMRYDYGAPLAYNRVRRGYYYDQEFSGLSLTGLNEQEQIALMLAREVLKSEHLDDLGLSIHSLIQRANTSYPSLFSLYNDKIEERISLMHSMSDAIREDQIICLIHALFEQQVLEFEYRRPGGIEMLRRVHPYHLTNADGDWYLKGHCETRNELRTFKLLRIKKLRMVEGPFLKNPHYDIEKSIKGSMGGFSGNAVYRISLELDSFASEFLQEKSLHPSQRLKGNEDGSSILTLELNSLMDIQRWVLSWGEHIRVLGPNQFVETIRMTLESTLKRYSDPL